MILNNKGIRPIIIGVGLAVIAISWIFLKSESTQETIGKDAVTSTLQDKDDAPLKLKVEPSSNLGLFTSELDDIKRVIDDIKHIDIDTNEAYDKCIALLPMLTGEALELEGVGSILERCRAVRNRHGVNKAKIREWNAIRKLVRESGWQLLVEKLKNGEIPLSASLQDGEPKHDLFTLLIGVGVRDQAAYQELIQLGLSPSSKALSVALIRGNHSALTAYENHANIFATDDLLYNAVFQAAIYGTLSDMNRYIEMGISYDDVLKRDPLAANLRQRASSITLSNFKEFVLKNNINLNSEHLSAVVEGGGNDALIDFIRKNKR